MKFFLYKLISKLGYSILNRNTQRTIELNKIKNFVAEDDNDILFNARENIVAISKYYPDLGITQKENGFQVKFSDFQFYVESAEDIFIIKEVFVDGDYGLNTTKPAIVLDIGMNIGITSIFFSQFNFVHNIYGFEPIPFTYEMAFKNIASNARASAKCELFNYGLSDKNGQNTFHFDSNNKGKTGIESHARGKGKLSKSVEVELKKSSEIINKLIALNPNKSVVVKMDCEGSEYAIFKDLDESGTLAKIDILLIEWHFYGSEALERILLKYNFDCNVRNLSTQSGFIFACRS